MSARCNTPPNSASHKLRCAMERHAITAEHLVLRMVRRGAISCRHAARDVVVFMDGGAASTALALALVDIIATDFR